MTSVSNDHYYLTEWIKGIEMSELKKYPSTITRCKGVVAEPSNFYSGKAVVLNTYYGELVLFSSGEDCIAAASELIMPNHFNLDIGMAQSVSIFSSDRVDISGGISNQELVSKLQADVELLREALGEICSGCDTVVSAASIADCALAAIANVEGK